MKADDTKKILSMRLSNTNIVWASLTALAATLVMVLSTTGTAYAGRNQTSPLRHTGGHFCVDVDQQHGPVHDGTKVQAWACNGSYAQQWSDINYYNTYDFSLVNSTSANRCLDVDQLHGAVHNGTVVQVWACNHSIAQRWQFEDLSSGPYYKWAGVGPNGAYTMCLDIDQTHGAAVDGTQMQVWQCNGTQSQAIRGPGVNRN